MAFGKYTVAALTLLASPVMAAGTDDLKDSEILAIYAQVNSFDIETAFLAISKDCAASTTELARHLSTDHLWVRRTVLDLAVENGLTYTLPAARIEAQITHDATMARLSELECDRFDGAFLEHDVAFHEAAIDAVRTVLLPAADNPALKSHFQDILPAFEHHLAMAKAVKAGGSVSDVANGGTE
ncbi:hypothetical protein ACMU_16385 [Actibacterium mucosum KCTC 23349]|uniref:DUF4142 domain-containing protein n=1 Tax=Actibacterium mucosum KCTC 23349 TaxID=1454373 RepID=A0A037ZEX9_9RHOB|nr:DUF4142 domain-containing protein [Actibacterium mucosum]KAJ54692.1 hypothetical protein ACMU_16385 [Actibacterium mucosum KCTC 23349]